MSTAATGQVKLNVLIGAESLYNQRSGIGRMTLEIALAAQRTSYIDRVRLLLDKEIIDANVLASIGDNSIKHTLTDQPVAAPKPIRIAIGKIPGVQALRRLKQGTLKSKVRQLAAETGRRIVYHEPNMITQAINLPTVTTINDLSWHHEPSWHPVERLRWIERNLQHTLKQATRFVVISEFTKKSFMAAFGISSERIDIVALAPAVSFRAIDFAEAQPVLARYDLVDRSYILSTSTIEPRKNFDRLLKAYLKLPLRIRQDVPLVIAGGQGWGDVLNLSDAQHAIRTGSLRMLGHVADTDLSLLCARAAVFAYISLYEGFGLPVVEAMATGTAVLASATTAVGELAKDAAVLVNPLDIDDIAAKLEQLLDDKNLNRQMQMSAIQKASNYTWAKTIDQLGQSWSKALK